MKNKYVAAIICLAAIFYNATVFGQQVLVNDARKAALNDLAVKLSDNYTQSHKQALSLAPSRGWAVKQKLKNGGMISLQGVNSLGFPIFLKTHNLESAQVTNTTALWPGGSMNLSFNGSSAFLDGKLAIWDGGSVYSAHQEFAGKNITLKDDTTAALDHSTHVAGTMIAKGVYLDAKGMSYGANTLTSYNFDNDVGKMSNAASNLLLSNHSYGDIAGWDQDEFGRWTWYGLPGDTVDYTFGFYGARTQAFDQIAYKAPYYLIVESAGNSQTENGPPVGGTYYGYKSRTDQTIVSKGPRPAGISSNHGYGNISATGNAKDILTVGAVDANSNIGYFSSFGPTTDGRIKPDIVGMGVNVLSTGVGIQSYLVESGTSMSAPNLTGSMYLLQEYYAQKHNGQFMHAATLKGLVCATANDLGNTGPDYIYGWGLLNMKNAALVIQYDGTRTLIKDTTLQQSQQQTYRVTATGDQALIATISWTDPAGPATADGKLFDRTPKLVNDLDVRVSDGSITYQPWVLDPSNPGQPATTGDNIRDNIEQVLINNPVAGKVYTISITHKGTLQSGAQAYSLISTGINGIVAPPANTNSDISLQIYPVPASNQLNIAFDITESKPLNLSLVNSAGRTVYSNVKTLTTGSFNISIDLTDIPPGVYAVKMLLGGKLYNRKVIVNK